MILPFSIVNPLTRIEVVRQLPQPGKVLVRERDNVETFQLVAEYTPPPQFAIINVSRELAVPPKKLSPYLEVRWAMRWQKAPCLPHEAVWAGARAVLPSPER